MSRSAQAPRATIVSVRTMRGSETTLTARSGGRRLRHLMHVYNEAELVDLLTTYESARIQLAIYSSTPRGQDIVAGAAQFRNLCCYPPHPR